MSGTKSLYNMTPYEAWFKKKPNMFHFKGFGCLDYVKVVDEKRQKIDSKIKACILIGYCEYSKGSLGSIEIGC